ncbi:hypothetical protein [Nocardia arthritidis]|uniref:Uncharacterized protein n=1 Tax=Nocardia arthritidis TaxID=228602 RepID=A0A6G9YD59_9NOCA|nr:hypothetical protein [Nocardia arthritidis]QIS11142.1 hypothetical protein F5544_16315 [Nocardia arthritidis]
MRTNIRTRTTYLVGIGVLTGLLLAAAPAQADSSPGIGIDGTRITVQPDGTRITDRDHYAPVGRDYLAPADRDHFAPADRDHFAPAGRDYLVPLDRDHYVRTAGREY